MGKWNNWADEQKLLNPKTRQKPLDILDTLDNFSLNDAPEAPPPKKPNGKEGTGKPKVAPSYKDGWIKVFPPNNAPDQTICWEKDGVRVPATIIPCISLEKAARLLKHRSWIEITSRLLGTNVYLVADPVKGPSARALFLPDPALPIYTLSEIKALAGLSQEEVKALHDSKVLFGGSIIEEWAKITLEDGKSYWTVNGKKAKKGASPHEKREAHQARKEYFEKASGKKEWKVRLDKFDADREKAIAQQEKIND